MLDTETKRRINTCRDILVGKVPDPKSQVEQITIALIYKFMDDMDMQAEELGGRRSFFTGEYERYGWAKLVSPGVGGQEMLNTYGEALSKMVENPDIPELFRSIFRNAYLPYRDPETLRSFLREINGFSYDHSEKLGDAFEYLLSVLGSQGDAGQFRTPRHIIDFMVEIIDPKKTEVILDPACGTAGFLISAYKHILKSNSTSVEPSTSAAAIVDASEATLESPQRYKGEMLSTDDRERLAKSLKGYDISPDMVRLSLVNLYLHGFVDPKVEEYDTLTSEAKWGQTADVILANPPFMSPKGGIKPHNRFGVVSKRSEVLFVDYIAEHLTPNGRAAIVVPEGIIFQSQGAYCELRKMLVEKFLVAVISLPAGVFNPYSGVKTSILILDRAAAKATDSIAFFKIENDGFGLGAQRRAVKGGQLGQVQAEYAQWIAAVRGGGEVALESALGFTVEKARLAVGGDFNLSGERYREAALVCYVTPRVAMGQVTTINPRKSEISGLPPETLASFAPMAVLNEHRINFAPSETKPIAEVGTSYTYFADGDVLLAKVTPCFENGKAGIALGLTNGIGFGSSEFYVLRPGKEVLAKWVYHCVMHPSFRTPAITNMTGTGGLQRVPKEFIERFEIPLPPLEVQQEIVAEIEGYQKIIDGARAVIENYRPFIPIDPAWPVVEIGKFCSLAGKITTDVDLSKPYFGADSFEANTGKLLKTETAENQRVNGPVYEFSGRRLLYSKIRPYLNKLTIVDLEGYCSSDMYPLIVDEESADLDFLAITMLSDRFQDSIRGYYERASIPKINRGQLFGTKIPLPQPEVQREIVAEIQAEQALVSGNRDLIARFEKKIEDTIARVWGEAEGGNVQ
jgi:type I restriction enzyme M protein